MSTAKFREVSSSTVGYVGVGTIVETNENKYLIVRHESNMITAIDMKTWLQVPYRIEVQNVTAIAEFEFDWLFEFNPNHKTTKYNFHVADNWVITSIPDEEEHSPPDDLPPAQHPTVDYNQVFQPKSTSFNDILGNK